MRIRLKWLLFALITVLFILFKYGGAFQPLELAIYDQYWQLAPLEVTDPRIIIVGIEEEDLQDLGKWPATDDQLAEIIDAVAVQKPTVIGLDIFRDLEVTGRLKEIFETNDRLIGVGAHYGINFPPILRAKKQVGDVNLMPEPEGRYIRRIPLYRLTDGSEDSQISHVSLKLAVMWLKEHSDSFSVKAHPKTNDLMLNDKVIPPLPKWAGGYSEDTRRSYQMLVRWRKGAYSGAKWEQNFKVVNLRQIKQGQVSPNLFTDKIVLIGARAISIKDQLLTPIGWRYGVDTIAHETSQILSYIEDERPFFRFIPEGVEYALILLMIALIYLHTRYLSFKRIWWELGSHCAIALTVLASIYGLGFWAFTRAWWIPVGQLLVTYGVTFALMLLGSYISYLHFITQNQEKIITSRTAELQKSLEDLKKAQEINILNAKQVTLAQLSNSLTHDLKTYFGILKGCMERLPQIMQQGDSELMESEIEIMKDSFTELDVIFQNLRGIFRESDFLQPSSFNLQTLILELVKAINIHSQDVELILEVNSIDVVLPQPLLQETLRNLIQNALESMTKQDKKRLKIQTSLIQAKEIQIIISDTGKGIASKNLSRIYDPFFTTKLEGWGFGLYFVGQAILYLQGAIEVESEEGKGSKFILTIPLNFRV